MSKDNAESLRDIAAALRADREAIRHEMGGIDRIKRVHAEGRLTIRERIDRLLDAGSFMEIGTFAHSERPEDAANSPGDGVIGGLGRVAGRPVAVVGDDVTVLRGTSARIGTKRAERILDQAKAAGHPLVYFGESGGARIPDTLGSSGFVRVAPAIDMARALRRRAIPAISVITGKSFGDSSFKAAFSDFVVQVRGSCLSIASPRVMEIATGEKLSFEELGGVDVHDKITGQIDRAADDEDHAIALVRQFLEYLPQNSWSEPARSAWDGDMGRDEQIYDLVPLRRQRGYDMRKVLRRLSDHDEIFEVKPNYGKSIITALSRVAGRSIGFVASQPNAYAGSLSPQCCDKITSFLCLCDSFNIPLIFVQDCPGFMVGSKVEHDKLLSRAIMTMQAAALLKVPTLTVVIRKAFGLAYYALNGSRMGADALAAWPNAEISFMDPEIGVNVVLGDKLTDTEDDRERRDQLVADWTKDNGPEGPAGIMELDEIIDPAETRAWLRYHVDRMTIDLPRRGKHKPLALWPTCV